MLDMFWFWTVEWFSGGKNWGYTDQRVLVMMMLTPLMNWEDSASLLCKAATSETVFQQPTRDPAPPDNSSYFLT